MNLLDTFPLVELSVPSDYINKEVGDSYVLDCSIFDDIFVVEILLLEPLHSTPVSSMYGLHYEEFPNVPMGEPHVMKVLEDCVLLCQNTDRCAGILHQEGCEACLVYFDKYV